MSNISVFTKIVSLLSTDDFDKCNKDKSISRIRNVIFSFNDFMKCFKFLIYTFNLQLIRSSDYDFYKYFIEFQINEVRLIQEITEENFNLMLEVFKVANSI